MIKHFRSRVVSYILRTKWRIKSKATISHNAILSKKTLVGKYVYLGNGNYANSEIGNYSYIASGHLPFCKIGNFTSIGSDVVIVSGSHPIKRVSTSPAFIKNSICSMKKRFHVFDFNEYIAAFNTFQVEIGNDVWIGQNVMIKEGVNIGDGAVIGMGSVVVKNVPPYAVVGGNPAKIIKYRFDDETRRKLMDIKWWTFSDENIEKYSCFFDNPQKLIDKYTEKNN